MMDVPFALTPGFIAMGFAHEGGIAIVAQRGFAISTV